MLKCKDFKLRLTAILTAIVTLIFINSYGLAVFAQSVQIENDEIIYGDINNDGVLNVFDLVLLKKYLLQHYELTDPVVADLNGDSVIDSKDVMLLNDFLLCRISTFPVHLVSFSDSIADSLSDFDQSILSTGQPIETSMTQDMAEWFSQMESPVAAYEYIYNYVDSEFYTGSRKGGIGSFQQNSGNDVDTASLLIAVLRYMGYEADYMQGTIRLTPEQAMKWTCTENIDVAIDILNIQGGKNVTKNVDSSGNITGITLLHTWVVAQIPAKYVNKSNSDTVVTVNLDANFKEYSAGSNYIDVFDNIGLEETQIEKLISVPVSSNEFTQVTQKIQSVAETDISSCFSRQIVSKTFSYFSDTPEYTIVNSNDSYSTIDLDDSDYITFFINDSQIAQLKTTELYNKRLVLEYDFDTESKSLFEFILDPPKTVLDITDYHTSSYGIRIQPVLKLDGTIVGRGSSCKISQKQILSMEVHSSTSSTRLENTLNAGSMYSIISDTQNISSYELIKAAQTIEKNININSSFESTYNDSCLGAVLDAVGKTYMSQLDLASKVMAEKNNIYSEKNTNVCLVSFNLDMTVTESFGYQSLTIQKQGTIGIDAEFLNSTVISFSQNNEDIEQYKLQYGIISSALESEVLENLTGIESVSTIKIFEKAQNEGIDIVTISKENLNQISNLNISENALSEISREVESGNTIIVPQENISINSWTGTGYIIIGADNSYTFRLSNGTSGGEISDPLNGLGDFLKDAQLIFYITAVVLAVFAFVSAGSALAAPVLATITTGVALPAKIGSLTFSFVVSMVSLINSYQGLEKYLKGEASTINRVTRVISTSWSLFKLFVEKIIIG